MKKVLIIGYLHPLTLQSGSVRVLPLAKNLPQFGWQPNEVDILAVFRDF